MISIEKNRKPEENRLKFIYSKKSLIHSIYYEFISFYLYQQDNLLSVFEWKDVTWLIGRQPDILSRRCENKKKAVIICSVKIIKITINNR